MLKEVVKLYYTQYNRVVHCCSFLKGSYYFNSFTLIRSPRNFKQLYIWLQRDLGAFF